MDGLTPLAPEPPRTPAALWLVLAFALVMRLAPIVASVSIHGGVQGFYQPDSHSYLNNARTLLDTGAFTNGGEPELVRTAGYPLMLLPGLLAGHVEWVTIALQILMSLWTVFLVYQLATLLTQRPGVGVLAALLYSIEPVSILMTCVLLAETPFGALFMLSAVLLVRYLGRESLGTLIGSSVALAVATHVRPASFYLPALLALGLSLRALFQPGRRGRLIAHAAVFFLVSAVIIGAWVVRNGVQARLWKMSAVTDIHLYFFNAGGLAAVQQGRPVTEIQREWGYHTGDRAEYLRIHPEQRDWEDHQAYAWMHGEAMRMIRADPWTYAKVHLTGMADLLLSRGTQEWFQMLGLMEPDRPGDVGRSRIEGGLFATVRRMLAERPLFVIASAVLFGVTVLIYLLAAVGLFSRDVRWGWATVMLVCLAMYFIVVAGRLAVSERYRHPAMAIACVFAGAGLAAVTGRRRREPASQIDVSHRPPLVE